MSLPRIPSLRRHRPSHQGVVTLNGHDVYLGLWPDRLRKPPPEVKTHYDAVVAEWLASGRRGIPGQVKPAEPVTVSQLIDAFWKHAQQHYRDEEGNPTSEQNDFRISLRPLRHLYAQLPAAEFSPLKLKAVRQLMIDGYQHPKYGPQEKLSRGVINMRIRRIVRMFKWAVSEELVPPDVLHGLHAVRGLEKGRTEAHETEPVTPVALAHVEATVPFLNRQVGAMVQLLRYTGMRPAEVCFMRTCDIDMTGQTWLYRPRRHKTAHRGKPRIIALGPKAKEILRPFLRTELEAFLFSPAEAEAERRASREAERKTPRSCGNRRGTNRKKKPRKTAGPRYTPSSFHHAITKAIERANAKLREKATEEAMMAARELPGEDAMYVPHWFPYQLRHTFATEVRRQHGLEASQVALGHASADVTQVYAERDLQLAVRVAEAMG
jgi:integrase